MTIVSPFPYLRFTVGPVRNRRQDGVLFEVDIPSLTFQTEHFVWFNGRGGWREYDVDRRRLLGLAGDLGLEGSLRGVCAMVCFQWKLYEGLGLTKDALFAWLHPALGDLRDLALSLRVMES